MTRAPQEANRLSNQAKARKSERNGALPSIGPFGELAERAARSSCPILITGETGVGKGHLAKWLHKNSRHVDGPFIPVNCGAIPESIIDSQLFGHVKGSFSGATSDHIGLVRAAEKGTLFLDEVGMLRASAQTRLLRLLQDREVQPVGLPRPIIVNVRVMAATNSDLNEEVAEKRFREDLLFRLDVVRIHVSPLRERVDELPGLLATFNRELAELYRQDELVFPPLALDVLKSYHWPGNIRQLRTVVERLHVLCPHDEITPETLFDVGQLANTASTPTASRSIQQVRDDELQKVLEESGGSVARTAAIFGVHRSTIYRWIRSREKIAEKPRSG